MADAGETFLRNISELGELLPKLQAMRPEVAAFCHTLKTSWDGGGKVLFAGNGGSSADAMHFAEELLVRFQKTRRAMPALALCDPTVLTCAANDFGYDEVFARQVEGLGAKGDVFVGLSTSGNSENIIRAVRAAKAKGMVTVLMSGKDGGKLTGQCDVELIVPCPVTHHIQEAHKLILHAVCEWVDSQV